MMLSWFRRIVSAHTVVALVALIVCAGAGDLIHSGGDDPLCAPVLVQHDASAHRFTAGDPAGQAPASHCPLCHLLHLLHTALSAHPRAAATSVTVEVRWLGDRPVAVALVTTSVPSRAPPSVTL
jgi:hypothetical protein